MPIKLKVYVNEDDALLFWSITKPIPECRGFAIQRRIKRKGKKKSEEDFLLNRTGFENEAYVVNIMGAYAHYRWRAFVSQTNRPLNGLKDNDRWQAPRLASATRDLRFFGV